MKKLKRGFGYSLINSRTKRIFVSVLPLLVFIMYLLIAVLFFIPKIDTIKEGSILRGAHRGNSVNYTENTLPAFQSALDEDKYLFIEFDVQYTKDKVIVVYHDLTLSRLQGKSEGIKDLTYNQLSEINSYHIPTYGEVLDLVQGKKPLNIEIKSQGNITDDKKMVDYIISDLKNRGLLKTTLISSISSDVLIYLNENYPEVETGKIYFISTSTFLHLDTFTNDLYHELNRTGADFLMVHSSNLRNYEELKRLLPGDKNLAVWYLLNDEIYFIQPTWFFGEELAASKPNVWTLFNLGKSKICLWWCETR
jgi:glycerophosphoryl diester phosphodiesterase